jgi:hypothetical protein
MDPVVFDWLQAGTAGLAAAAVLVWLILDLESGLLTRCNFGVLIIVLLALAADATAQAMQGPTLSRGVRELLHILLYCNIFSSVAVLLCVRHQHAETAPAQLRQWWGEGEQCSRH